MPITAERTVFAEVVRIVRDVLGDSGVELTPNTTADDVPGWDSMAHITLIVEAECRFGVQFQIAEIEGLHNLGELVQAIESKHPRVAA
ncbi:MAG TPA: acyl carrier protein [Acetobacteraceae bacterium]|jgi:acyl carrier protein